LVAGAARFDGLEETCLEVAHLLDDVVGGELGPLQPRRVSILLLLREGPEDIGSRRHPPGLAALGGEHGEDLDRVAEAPSLADGPTPIAVAGGARRRRPVVVGRRQDDEVGVGVGRRVRGGRSGGACRGWTTRLLGGGRHGRRN